MMMRNFQDIDPYAVIGKNLANSFPPSVVEGFTVSDMCTLLALEDQDAAESKVTRITPECVVQLDHDKKLPNILKFLKLQREAGDIYIPSAQIKLPIDQALTVIFQAVKDGQTMTGQTRALLRAWLNAADVECKKETGRLPRQKGQDRSP